MSTRCSVACGDDYHLYEECFDEDNIYLEHAGGLLVLPSEVWALLCDRGLRPPGVTLEVWECVRGCRVLRLRLLDETEDELRARLQKDIEARIKDYQEGRTFAALCGLFVFGPPEDPSEVQLERGVAVRLAEKDRQQARLARYERLSGLAEAGASAAELIDAGYKMASEVSATNPG